MVIDKEMDITVDWSQSVYGTALVIELGNEKSI